MTSKAALTAISSPGSLPSKDFAAVELGDSQSPSQEFGRAQQEPAGSEDGVYRINPDPNTGRERAIAYLQLMFAAFPWIGVQAIWATEFGVTTPYLEGLGLSPNWASQIWVAGPVMGFVVAPIVGSLSDRCRSRFGRRRPFMLGGLLMLIIASMLLATAKYFPDPAQLPVGCTMFVLLDGIINVIQTPLRALLADVAPPRFQGTAQLMAAMFQGLGGLVGYVLQRFLYTNPTQVVWLFVSVLIVNVLILGTVAYFLKEERYEPALTDTAATEEAQNSAKSSTCQAAITPFIELAKSVKKLDGRIARVMLVEFFSWWALFAWWPTSSTWFTETVMGGCPDDPADNPSSVCTPESYSDYQRGLKMNADANIVANAMQLCYSLLLSLLMSSVLKRVRFLWATSLAFGCVILLLTKWGPKEDWYAMFAAITIAIPISAINSFPFAVVGKYQQDDQKKTGAALTSDTATMFGLLNLSIVIPQIIVTFAVGSMRTDVADGLSWVLVMAGMAMGIAAAAALFVIEVVTGGGDPATDEPELSDLERGVDVTAAQNNKVKVGPSSAVPGVNVLSFDSTPHLA